AAAQMQPPAAQHTAAADVVILIDRDHRSAVVTHRDGGSKASHARANDDDVGGMVPFDLGVGFRCGRASQRGRADAGCGTLRQKGPAAQCFRSPALVIAILRAHRILPYCRLYLQAILTLWAAGSRQHISAARRIGNGTCMTRYFFAVIVAGLVL